MTDIEFNRELKDFISNLWPVDRQVIKTEFYINLQPGMTSFGGHFIFADNETIPINIRLKSKTFNSDFVQKIEYFHRQSTNGGLNKWNKALFKIENGGQVKYELTWDEVWNQEEIECHKRRGDSVRQKWYWEEK